MLHLHTLHAPEQEYRPRFFGQFEQHGGRELKLLPVYKNVLRRKILLAVAILIEWFVKMIAVGNLLSQMIGQNAARCLEHVGAEVAALQFGSIAALDQAAEPVLNHILTVAAVARSAAEIGQKRAPNLQVEAFQRRTEERRVGKEG